jgi:hypothetical protein
MPEARRSTRLNPSTGEATRLEYLVKNSNMDEQQMVSRYGLDPRMVRDAMLRYGPKR